LAQLDNIAIIEVKTSRFDLVHINLKTIKGIEEYARQNINIFKR